MIRCLRRAFPLLLLLLASCTLPSAAPASFTPLGPGMARIVFYRDVGYYDSATVLRVALNGAATGIMPRGEVFYRDVTPGSYAITFTPTRPVANQFKTITPAAGQVLYVKLVAAIEMDCSGTVSTMGACDISGFTAVITDPGRAQQEIKGLSLVHG